MGKSSKAANYATTTTKTDGLFGSSTSGQGGTSFTGEDWQKKQGNLGANLINQSLSNLASTDYSNDANFKVFQDDFNRQASQAYDANVLNPLTNRGLMRSSGLQAATNSFNNTLADNLADLQDSYYNRNANTLSNALNSQNNLFSWITGLNNSAQQNAKDVSTYNLNKWTTEKQNSLFKYLLDASSNAAGQAAGVAMAASDINVKENIKKIGEKNGYNWYEFTYKEGLGLPEGRQEGVIAQEVEAINPDAVTEINGIKHVDYSKL